MKLKLEHDEIGRPHITFDGVVVEGVTQAVVTAKAGDLMRLKIEVIDFEMTADVTAGSMPRGLDVRLPRWEPYDVEWYTRAESDK